jgi:hypothetical protein
VNKGARELELHTHSNLSLCYILRQVADDNLPLACQSWKIGRHYRLSTQPDPRQRLTAAAATRVADRAYGRGLTSRPSAGTATTTLTGRAFPAGLLDEVVERLVELHRLFRETDTHKSRQSFRRKESLKADHDEC